MSLVPDLRVVPLAEIVPHEDFDPLRVDMLAGRISKAGSQRNPVICIEADTGLFVLLDGATRTAALHHLGLGYVLVQVVPADAVTLETWHHVIRNADPDQIVGRIEANEDLVLSDHSGAPGLVTADGRRATVTGSGSKFGVLSALVDAYIGQWRVNRVVGADLGNVPTLFPDWAALIELPTLTVDDVMKAALSDDRLPAGVTRFIVPDRALGVRLGLEVLADGAQAERQGQLDRLIEGRVGEGRIRRYPQSVVLFDE